MTDEVNYRLLTSGIAEGVSASLNFGNDKRGNYLPEIDSKSTYKMKQLISERN